MKYFREMPVRIFIVVLLTGIIGITGIVIMRQQAGYLTEQYHVVMDEHVEKREMMSRILAMVYQHRSVISNCLLVTDKAKKDELDTEESELIEQLQKELGDFGEKMQGGEREVLYHTLYSSFQSYLQTVSVAHELYGGGKEKAASDYVATNLVDSASKINDNIRKLDSHILLEMDEAREKIEDFVDLIRITALVCTVMIIVSVGLCLFYCVKVTITLDRQRTGLAQEVERQTEELRKHNDRMLNIKDQTIIGMANLIENRDGDTGEHIKRTSMYVEMIAREAKKIGYCRGTLTDRYIELLVKAAPMHDVGKIVVPDHILKKPGKLTEEEFGEIKRHAAEGGRIVREVLGNIEDFDYVDIAAQIAEGHHEKWNGSGYPYGKKEDDIPLCARIMAIADVYDALVSKRCYKDSMSCEHAMTIIEESAGSHFDPTLAGLFIHMKEDVRAISDASVY